MIVEEEIHPSLWVEHDYSRIDIRLLPVGLHIYVWRGALLYEYSHHGIYIGDGRVIHSIGPKAGGPRVACKKCAFAGNMQQAVVETCLECFLCGGRLCRYNYDVPMNVLRITSHVMCSTCTSKRSKPANEVVETAKRKLKEGFGTYNLISNNCEHFATFSKTGTSLCQQVPGHLRI
ncbi:unnamed protein product [Dovyalis caffra]|uniref:LRAT domain-containing protein n=1 Tax=Dovyalis caffra TaxID=77055 RepID=A0AAV1RWC3_9ROSI|nr:unnamed protein product [Dovyalis caffra]